MVLLFLKNNNFFLLSMTLVLTWGFVEGAKSLVGKGGERVHFTHIHAFGAIGLKSQCRRGGFYGLIGFIHGKIRTSGVRKATVVCARKLSTID